MSTPRRSDPALSGILATDQYQLTMAQLYWKEGLAERTAQFDFLFRNYPDYGDHQAGYCISAGLGWLLEWMEGARFTRDDLEVLSMQRTPSGGPRFDRGFIDWLEHAGDLASLEMRAIPEGRVVHPNAPMATVSGPLALAQIFETHLLNRLNYPTLIATKASRASQATRGGMVLEFGLRRGPESLRRGPGSRSHGPGSLSCGPESQRRGPGSAWRWRGLLGRRSGGRPVRTAPGAPDQSSGTRRRCPSPRPGAHTAQTSGPAPGPGS